MEHKSCERVKPDICVEIYNGRSLDIPGLRREIRERVIMR